MKSLIFLLTTITGSVQLAAQPVGDDLIFPDPARKIVLVTADAGRFDMPHGTLLSDDTFLSIHIYKELSHPFIQSLLRLNQCSRNLAGNLEGPNVLFLSQNQGGFARQGLVLNENGESSTYPILNYVDLVIDPQRLEAGKLDIFPHELGHVMMNNVWTLLGLGAEQFMSPKMHVSMGVTDYYTALFEGFGEHFQRLTHEEIPFYQEKFGDRLRRPDNSTAAWHSTIDEELRVNAVLQNQYIFRKLLPQGKVLDSLSVEEKILFHHASPAFDPSRLKNAQEMLACEGWTATLFYRMSRDSALRNSYAAASFYRTFLRKDIPEQRSPKQVFTPFENVMLKHFWVWSRLNQENLVGKIPLMEYIRAWAEAFPDDREPLLKLFLGTSVGKTITNEVGEKYEQMAWSGLIGDYFQFVEERKVYQEALENLIQKALRGDVRLDTNIGPELWITHEDFRIRRALWMAEPNSPLRVNVNTASIYELAPFTGLAKAEELVRKRDERGYFSSLEGVEGLSYIRKY